MCRNEKSSNNLKILGSVLVWGFILILVTATAVAGVSSGAETKSTAPKIIEKFEVEEDFGVRKALAMLGSQCQKNIVPSPGVNGSLAFRRLTNVTFEEAMNAILGDNAVYEEQGNLIKVYTKEEYQKIMEDPGRMICKVFTLYYMSASEAVKLITPLKSAVGNIQASSPPEMVASTGESITTGTLGGDTMALNDTIVVNDYPENIAAISEMLKKLDVRPKQVLVEATILSATLQEGMKLGVDLNFAAGASLTGSQASSADAYNSAVSSQTPIGQIAAGTPGAMPMETTGFASVGGSGLRLGITSGDVAAFITALETITDTTVLANPKILAVNKQLGQVYIGQKIGYTSSTTQTQTSTTQQVEFLDTGTKLSFRPYIGDDGYIRMDIHPKDSSGTLKTNEIPDEFSTELATNIMVRDGETVVIGGLFRDVVVTSRSQIPLLGDLPLVGAVFRGTTDTVTRQEVIVLLTPHIIDDPNETDGTAREDDVQRKRFGAEDELQKIDRGKLAEVHYAKALREYDAGQTEEALKEVKSALRLRPSYLEAIRLKERIIAEKDGRQALDQLERKMSESMDHCEAPSWLRR